MRRLPTFVFSVCFQMLVAGVAPGGLIQLYNTLLLERSLVDLQTNQSEA